MTAKKAFSFLALALLLFMVDGALKAYVHYNIPTVYASFPVYPFGGIGVFKDWYGIDFSIVHVINRGAAWGIFSSMQEYLLYVRVAIIGGLLAYLVFGRTSSYRKFSLMLVTTGALGNVIDYFVYGHVVDMFYFIFWGRSYPVFNLADSVIFTGILLLIIEGFVANIKAKTSSKNGSQRSA
jgi:signal peptidase II